MKHLSNMYRVLITSILLVLAGSCSFFEVEETIDPNSPSVEAFLNNATRGQIDQLATGVFASMRGGFADYFRITGSLGREVYVLATNESRWYNELLGTAGSIDNANFLNAYYPAFFATVRRASLFGKSAQSSSALSAAEKEAAQGFANTVKAFAMLHALNMQGANGIRIDLEDVLNPGPIVSYDLALTEIKRLLDLGNSQLANGGTTFSFAVPAGFLNFSSPVEFAKFNRALAARVALYQQDWNGVLSILPNSYMNLTGPLTSGPVFTYANSPDVNNPLFQTVNSTQATLVVVHPSFENAFGVGDLRATKIRQRSAPRSLGGLTGSYEPALYAANTSPIPLLKNEELILIYAEASVNAGGAQNVTNAIDAINIIRTAANIPPYAGSTDQTALIDEILNQRKLSLWYEGHRWIDARRYDKLNTIPLDLATHQVFNKLPIPFAEVQWDASN